MSIATPAATTGLLLASLAVVACASKKDETKAWAGGAVTLEVELPQAKFDPSRQVDVVVWGVAPGARSDERMIPHASLAEPVPFDVDDAKPGDAFRAQVLGYAVGGCAQIIGQASVTVTGERVRVGAWTFSEHDICQLL